MICKKCGKEIPDNSKFCNFCGSEQDIQIDKKEEPKSNIKLKKGRLLKLVFKRSIENDNYRMKDENDPYEIKAKEIYENIGVSLVLFVIITLVISFFAITYKSTDSILETIVIVVIGIWIIVNLLNAKW